MDVAAEQHTAKTAVLIDGRRIAEDIQTTLKQEVVSLREKNSQFSPLLAIVQVGDRNDSSVYVRMKQKAAEAIGLETRIVKLQGTASQGEVLAAIDKLNANPAVHGILVQLPLPEGISEAAVTDAVTPQKDVDGLHPVNVGRLSKRQQQPLFAPCTPKGIMELLRRSGMDITGKRAVVVGRSDLVGSPTALLLTTADATVTLCHSKTRGLPDIVRQADILVVAIGKPEFIRSEWIKPGAVVIDVGMNSVPDSSKKSGSRWVGDVDYEGALKVASAITPVPGGVGPMTVAMLMKNVVKAAKHAAGMET